MFMRVAAAVAGLIALAWMPLPAKSQDERAAGDAVAAGHGGGHAFTFTAITGEPLPLAGYAGRAVLVVNTASLCGFTPQYAELQALWERYRDQGLVVLGVPSNDFGGQEPGSEAEIKDFCEVNYGIEFPLTQKETVRGPRAHPFYRWAEAELGSSAAPKWNFHKYLLAPDGRLAASFPTSLSPLASAVVAAIEQALAAPETGS
jgi:glutathione peroxidase